MQASVAAKQWVTAEAIFRAMTEKYGHADVVSRQSTLHFIQVRLVCGVCTVGLLVHGLCCRSMVFPGTSDRSIHSLLPSGQPLVILVPFGRRTERTGFLQHCKEFWLYLLVCSYLNSGRTGRRSVHAACFTSCRKPTDPYIADRHGMRLYRRQLICLALFGWFLLQCEYGCSSAARLLLAWTRLDSFTLQSMVMQKKLRKVISYVSRVQYLPLEGPSPKGTLDVALLKCFRTIPGVGSEVGHGLTFMSCLRCLLRCLRCLLRCLLPCVSFRAFLKSSTVQYL